MTKMDASIVETTAGSDANRRRILVVEDNLADARLFRELLKDAGGAPYEVTDAASLADGIHYLKAEHYDAVLLDLSLPDGLPPAI